MFTYSHRCGLQKGRAVRRTTLHSRPALSVVNPRITKNFSAPISYRQISRPIELHPAPNISGSKKEKTPRPCKGPRNDMGDLKKAQIAIPFFLNIWLAAYKKGWEIVPYECNMDGGFFVKIVTLENQTVVSRRFFKILHLSLCDKYVLEWWFDLSSVVLQTS
jgi:hypothetical protein